MAKAKKEKILLNASKREILGKKVKKLRAEGKLPANIFGEGFKSQSITIPFQDFNKAYKEAGETQVVYVTVGPDEHSTLIDSVQRHPISNQLLHADFKKISLKKKIEADVPLEFIGESDAVSKNRGDMLTFKDYLTVNALPDAIPTHIDIDISTLTDVDSEISLSQVPHSSDYEFVDPEDTILVRIVAHKEESVEPDTSTEMPEITEESTETQEDDESETKSESANESESSED